MKFFDREEEIREIISIIESEPQRINFIYGSINSGKTALINEIINNRLDKDRYVVFYINLRAIFLSKYEEFIEVLFEEYEDDKKPMDVIKAIINDLPSLYGIPIPKNTLNELLSKKRSKNVFRYIIEVFEDIKKDGKQPILIIDELQKIGDMKINGFLIYELFNFFVDLTKELHLCHVFCLSSDSLFIERVYNEAMLKGRVDYILVDDFDKETALKFIDFLSKEILDKELSNEDKELIYNYVGGKPVDIIYVIDKLKIGNNLKDTLELILNDEISKLDMFLEFLDYSKPEVEIGNNIYEIKKEDIVEALKLFKDNYEIPKKDISTPIYVYLVKRNILFLNPQRGVLKPQSYLVWNAIKRLL
jgi:AAA+ ATPase superfamily predicted ATPase